MAAMVKGPIYLTIGDTERILIGEIEMPFTSAPSPDGLTLSLDVPEMQHRVADVLRKAADLMDPCP